MLSIESAIAKKIDFPDMINVFEVHRVIELNVLIVKLELRESFICILWVFLDWGFTLKG
jgi:hypothetical protein